MIFPHAVGFLTRKNEFVMTSSHLTQREAFVAVKELEKTRKNVQLRYDHQGSIDPGAMMTYSRSDSF